MKTRILLVDDEWEFTSMLKRRLEAVGPYTVREENNARQALRAAREFLPDLVVLDVMMPGMDGAEVAAAIRADWMLSEMPILFVTALVCGDESVDGAMLSRRQYVPKSAPMSRLVDRIEEKLRSVRAAAIPA